MRALLHILLHSLQTLRLLPVGTALICLLSGTSVCLGENAAENVTRAEEFIDSARIHFHTSRTELDMKLRHNGDNLQRMTDSLNAYALRDSLYKLKSVKVIGGASPEGSVPFNQWLSEHRAQRIFDYFSSTISMPDSVTDFTYLGRDWRGLRRLIDSDTTVPYRDEVTALLDSYLTSPSLSSDQSDRLLRELKRLRGGVPYRYLLSNSFPDLRASRLYIVFERTPDLPPLPAIAAEDTWINLPVPTIHIPPEPLRLPSSDFKPFYMALKSNMLLDVLALPNIGAEFYLGRDFSVGADWTYGWWKSDRRHRYWRAYGGDITARWWFGSAAARKPLTGHHIGIYGGVLTYDFEWGGTGYMGGRPGHNLWDRCMLNAGIEYGYSLPIARRLNIDFTIGFGYLGGLVEKYTPVNGNYIWESTSRKTWIGPTKAEISLVWLIGRGNYNAGKGGRR